MTKETTIGDVTVTVTKHVGGEDGTWGTSAVAHLDDTDVRDPAHLSMALRSLADHIEADRVAFPVPS